MCYRLLNSAFSLTELIVTGLEVAPSTYSIEVKWGVTDECNVNTGFEISWENNKTKVDSVTHDYTITNLLACVQQTVTVTPLENETGSVSTNTKTLTEGICFVFLYIL